MDTVLKQLNGTCGKGEELAWLQIVKQQAGEGSFMAGLFTDKLVEWLEQQLQDDSYTDLFAELECARQNERVSDGLVVGLRTSVAELTKMIETVQNEMRQRVGEAERRAEGAEVVAAQRLGDIRSYEHDIEGLDEQIREEVALILALKAELFDLHRAAGRI